MTSVSPFDTAIQLGGAMSASPVSSGSTLPANAFAMLLDSRKSQDQVVLHRTFGFGELGMFGLHAVQPPVDPNGGVKTTEASSSLTQKLAGRQERDAERQAKPQVLVVPHLVAGLNEAARSFELGLSNSKPLVLIPLSDASTSTLPNAAAQPSDASAPGAVPTETSGTGSNVPLRAMSIPTLPPPQSPVNPVNLVVSGPNDALTVVARSQDEPVHNATTIRRLVEVTVVEFEMHMAKFQINGQESQPIFSIGGGVYGGRAR